MQKRLAFFVLILAFAPLALVRAAEPTQPAAVTIPGAVRLGEWAPPCFNVQRIATPDGCHLAYVTFKDNKQVVVLDGKPSPTYDRIDENTLTFSPDGKLAYIATADFKARDDYEAVYIDGIRGPKFDDVSGPIVFSPDGRNVAYPVLSERRSTVALNSKAGRFENAPFGPNITFSPDGNHLAYRAKDGNKVRLIIDDQPGPSFDQIVPNPRLFSPDGKHTAYWAKNGEKWFVLHDGQPGPEQSSIGRGLFFSPDSKHLAHSTGEMKGMTVILDGRPGAEYDYIFDLKFTGKNQLMYVARKGRMSYVVTDTQAVEYGYAGQITCSADGERTAYMAKKDGKPLLVVDGKASPVDDFGYGLTFSPDGKHLAYVEGRSYREEASVVLDGKPGPKLKSILTESLIFSPDSKHLAYVVANSETRRIILDGEPGPEFDNGPIGLYAGPVFRRDGSLEYIAAKGNVLYRVTVPAK